MPGTAPEVLRRPRSRSLTRQALVLALLLCGPSGCILPSSTHRDHGRLLTETRNAESRRTIALDAGCGWPDLRLEATERRRTTRETRIGTQVVIRTWRYDFPNDLAELVIGPVLFVGSLLDLGHGILTWGLESRTFVKMLHLVTTLPVLEHRDSAELGSPYELTGEISWKDWQPEDTQTARPLADRRLQLLDEDGAVLFEVDTGPEGVAYVNLEVAGARLMRKGRPPTQLRDAESGRTVPLKLGPARARLERLRDAAPSSAESDGKQRD